MCWCCTFPPAFASQHRYSYLLLSRAETSCIHLRFACLYAQRRRIARASETFDHKRSKHTTRRGESSPNFVPSRSSRTAAAPTFAIASWPPSQAERAVPVIHSRKETQQVSDLFAPLSHACKNGRLSRAWHSPCAEFAPANAMQIRAACPALNPVVDYSDAAGDGIRHALLFEVRRSRTVSGHG
jgi:hypothetical protein